MWAQDAADCGSKAVYLLEAAPAQSSVERRPSPCRVVVRFFAYRHSAGCLPNPQSTTYRATEVDPGLLIRLCVHNDRALTLASPRG